MLEPDGTFDVVKAKKRGVTKLIRKVRFDRNGALVGIELYNAQHALELMGKHWDVWKDSMDDPDEVFERLLGIPRKLIPAKLDDSVNLQLNRSGTYVVPGANEEEEIEGPGGKVSDKVRSE